MRVLQDERIRIEVAENIEVVTPPPAEGLAGVGSKTVAQITDAGAAIADVCTEVFTKVKGAVGEARPDELTLEFGVTLGADFGAPIITKVSGEAALKVTAKWSLG